MPSAHNILSEYSYPGSYTPKRQILKVMYEGLPKGKPTTGDSGTVITESDSNYKIELSLPGVTRENLLVTINEKGNLRICGMQYKHKKGASLKGKQLSKKDEVNSFVKEISLPEYVDPSFTSATCHAGTLTIFFTKSEIPVKKRPSVIVVY